MSRLEWQVATVEAVVPETPRVKTFVLRLPRWQPHRAGQHYTLRLTAPDGYQAQRSYSVASPPEQTGQIALTVELIEEGEVSGYLFEGVEPGDQLEVRGPIGGYFVWEATPQAGPLLLVAGGAGVVPLMAMLRHRQHAGVHNPTVLLYSVRAPEDVIYHRELLAMAATDATFTLLLTYTRHAPAGWTGYQRRPDAAMLAEAARRLPAPPDCFICGPTGLVEATASYLAAQGISSEAIRTERFGPGS
ncbi:ferredoxin-NADP reductase [Hymenobacter luteus]|uniref:Ferredoxin-NADP reductase n=2 Tax=Hymenobacter TaxID=89966 RepID=A0A7W9T1X1_9BACT|nr:MULTISPECIES: ferredoxin reductase [Hymenobacter]MBB4602292.1 ferredoxin-NADP reductase [Hymenobacter latericoloratus]MBB6059279.1 ferredoxin-NADP reductase [Hymenobacter luteus]